MRIITPAMMLWVPTCASYECANNWDECHDRISWCFSILTCFFLCLMTVVSCNHAGHDSSTMSRHPCNWVLARDAEQVAALLNSSVGFVSSNCVAAIPVPVRRPPTGKYYPDAAPLTSSTCFCTGSGIYVHQLHQHLRFALVHGMSSPSRQLPGNPMRGPQQHEIIIVHWTCWHVYWNPSPTSRNLGCVLQLLP